MRDTLGIEAEYPARLQVGILSGLGSEKSVLYDLRSWSLTVRNVVLKGLTPRNVVLKTSHLGKLTACKPELLVVIKLSSFNPNEVQGSNTYEGRLCPHQNQNSLCGSPEYSFLGPHHGPRIWNLDPRASTSPK